MRISKRRFSVFSANVRPAKPVIVLFTVVTGLVCGLMAGGFGSLVHDLPEINDLKQFKPSAVSTLFSSDHKVLDRIYLERRYPVLLKDIPRHLIDALLATEDRQFYAHSGVNLKAIARAVIHDIMAGSFKQGGSTLTQQLAKTLFLSPEKSIVRKIREALLAVQIERRYTKEEILGLYLNQIYLGSGAYGVEAAARTYFNTGVSDLTLGQAALIAGLPKAPSVYSPLKNPDLAAKRRAIVLNAMLTQGMISTQARDQAIQEPLTVGTDKASRPLAPFFTAFVKQRLKDFQDLNYTQGLSIHTTLDTGLQQAAEQAVARHLARLEKRMKKHGTPAPAPQAAVIALDVHTGAIRAMVGGRDFWGSQFNRAVQALRQPGSAFKPMVYAAAVIQGYEQTQLLLDAPLTYSLPGNRTWQVNNFSRTYKGEVSLRKALGLSLNTPVVRLAEIIGPQRVAAFAASAGITTPLPPFLSLALGSAEVSLMEMTSAYTPFANHGTRAQPFAVETITDMDNQLVFRHRIQKDPVMTRAEAAILADMLKAAVYEGTGKKAAHIKKDIAGKTGTTNQYKDAWFIGFSPDLACGVWVGNDNAQSLGPGETGSRAALPIWIDLMATFLARQPFQYFDIPPGTKMVYIHPDPAPEPALDSAKDTTGPPSVLIRTHGM